MKASILSNMLRFLVLGILAMTVLAGCDNDSTGPENADPELTIWLGSYTESGGDDSGAIMLDISSDGRKVTAEVLVRSREQENPDNHIYLEGSADGDDIDLHIDSDIPCSFEFNVQLTLGPGGTMTGSFYHSAYDMTADFDCTELEWADATVDTFVDVSVGTLGMAFDRDHIWICTFGMDYFLMDSTLALVDTIAVVLEGFTHWTSDALTSDGNVLWGQYATSEGGSQSLESDIIEFRKNGEIIRRFRVGHRIRGLAWGGEDLWSLSIESDSLYRVDLEGSVLEAVAVGVPDLADIEFDGNHFWSIGGVMRRLYKISSTGDILMVYHFPGEHNPGGPAGLAFDGSLLWCCFNKSYPDSRIYGLIVE